jgi:hypothetical protein
MHQNAKLPVKLKGLASPVVSKLPINIKELHTSYNSSATSMTARSYMPFHTPNTRKQQSAKRDFRAAAHSPPQNGTDGHGSRNIADYSVKGSYYSCEIVVAVMDCSPLPVKFLLKILLFNASSLLLITATSDSAMLTASFFTAQVFAATIDVDNYCVPDAMKAINTTADADATAIQLLRCSLSLATFTF